MRVATVLLTVTASIACGGRDSSPTSATAPVAAFQGQWTGSYRVDRCTPFPSDSYARFCTGYAPTTDIPLTMTFSQNGEVVAGQFVAGSLVSSAFVSALDAQAGIQIRALTSSFPYAYDFTWRLSAPAGNQMTGTVLIVRTGNAGLVGGANIEGTITTLAR